MHTTAARPVTSLRSRPGCITPRRYATLRFRNVWAARLARHEDRLRIAATVAAAVVTALLLAGLGATAVLWQQGLL